MFRSLRNVSQRKKDGRDSDFGGKEKKRRSFGMRFSFKFANKKEKSWKKLDNEAGSNSKNTTTTTYPVAYQVSFRGTASGNGENTKRRIQWCFGYPDIEALEAGKLGSACKGEEHVVLVELSDTGKCQIIMDKEVILETVIRKKTNYNPRKKVLEHRWIDGGGNHKMKVIARAAPVPGVNDFRQYDFLIDKQSFFTLPKVVELGGSNYTARTEMVNSSSGSFAFPSWLASQNRSSGPAEFKSSGNSAAIPPSVEKEDNNPAVIDNGHGHWVGQTSTNSSTTAETHEPPQEDFNLTLTRSEEVENVVMKLEQDSAEYRKQKSEVKIIEETSRETEGVQNELLTERIIKDNVTAKTETDLDEMLQDIESVVTDDDNNDIGLETAEEEETTFKLEHKQKVEETIHQLVQEKSRSAEENQESNKYVDDGTDVSGVFSTYSQATGRTIAEDETTVSDMHTIYTQNSGRVVGVDDEDVIIRVQALARGFLVRSRRQRKVGATTAKSNVSFLDEMLQDIESVSSSPDDRGFWGSSSGAREEVVANRDTKEEDRARLDYRRKVEEAVRQLQQEKSGSTNDDAVSVYTYHSGQILFDEDEEVHHAVVLIQAIVRGFLARRVGQIQSYLHDYLAYQRRGGDVSPFESDDNDDDAARQVATAYFEYSDLEDSLSLRSGISELTADEKFCIDMAQKNCPEKTHGAVLGTVIAVGALLLI